LNPAEIKHQARHYLTVLRWMLGSYYRQERGSFWLIQITMGLSVGLGLAWLLGVIAGLQFLNDSTYLNQFELPLLVDFFHWPLGVWLSVLTLAGLLGTACMYLSIHIGVQSILRFQVTMLKQVMESIGDDNWLAVVADTPRKKTHRILKLSVQMTGLIVRRLVRMLIPLLTFVVAFYALVQLNLSLLMVLIPLSVLYLVALYFINRYAARNQVKLMGVSEQANKQVGRLIDDLYHRRRPYDSHLREEVDQTAYLRFSRLRYRRRLAEIHVTWVNGIFLVLGSAMVVFSFALDAISDRIDWMNLILFLVALRYASGAIQELASATVGFSRFLPESEMIHQILTGQTETPVVDQSNGLVLYLDENNDIEFLLPDLLRLRFGADNSYSLAEFQENSDVVDSSTSTWVYSVKPAKFKQAVKQNQERISTVVVAFEGQYKKYHDVSKFLEEFDPQEFIKNKQQQGVMDDDDMY